ncbi:gp41 [Listeria phage P35]|uniref:Winged helix-turn-helix DNA-binding domain-containing protein n=1 Tax=Listeria phage LP-083-1 TaxID=1458854 RepID=A0A059T802_9CAUD|nr:gp41 [Listeria phage P35]AAY53226.1 gp41 [Listeria phage P35]AHL19006.1 winged helix-turn-helix DNA-binding domain-containing protein [Listeria phage LP-083-1]
MSIIAYNPDHETALTFDTVKEASVTLGIDPSNIRKVLKGKRKQSNGYTFEEVEWTTPVSDNVKTPEQQQAEFAKAVEGMSVKQAMTYLHSTRGILNAPLTSDGAEFYLMYLIYTGQINSTMKVSDLLFTFVDLTKTLTPFETVIRTKRRLKAEGVF